MYGKNAPTSGEFIEIIRAIQQDAVASRREATGWRPISKEQNPCSCRGEWIGDKYHATICAYHLAMLPTPPASQAGKTEGEK
jgi:hypothetical protein